MELDTDENSAASCFYLMQGRRSWIKYDYNHG